MWSVGGGVVCSCKEGRGYLLSPHVRVVQIKEVVMAERTNSDTFLFTSESVGEGHAGEQLAYCIK